MLARYRTHDGADACGDYKRHPGRMPYAEGKAEGKIDYDRRNHRGAAYGAAYTLLHLLGAFGQTVRPYTDYNSAEKD